MFHCNIIVSIWVKSQKELYNMIESHGTLSIYGVQNSLNVSSSIPMFQAAFLSQGLAIQSCIMH